ncbi:hypothetical protein [Prosthecomicrobium hirschii]|uniref:hypothetical protein n=1 Tax=Prosthecodimorpha hirschii TaxID=665126 RepID=UPI00221EDCFE|nr:hypothetical protein [Prosthecomicrobium hirschii]MCW1842630.1 hypothetical protein [Prosthecomicrobium hirschii]
MADLSVDRQLAAAGLKLPPGDVEKLTALAADLAAAAATVRRDWSYLTEPVQALRLWKK